MVEDWFDRVIEEDFDEADLLYGHCVETGEPYAFFVEEINA